MRANPPSHSGPFEGGRIVRIFAFLSRRKKWQSGPWAVGQFDYEASGTDIFCLHAGPDGSIYGSSILPLHLFRYNPKGGELVDLGKCSEAGGEAYSMANLDGKLYIAAYPAAELSVYEPATETKNAYYRIVGDASCYTLAHLESERLIAVGTSISGGSGTRPKVVQAVLFLWDYQAEKKVWEGTLDRPASAFNALVAGPDGKLYGTAVGGDGPELFVFDAKTRAFGKRLAVPSGSPLDLGLQNGPDSRIYGFTSDSLYQLDPAADLSVRVLARDRFSAPGPICGQEIYFGTGPRLRAVTITHRDAP